MTREMKDSGVEWIGEIPKHWEISKIGAHYIERNEKVSDLDYEPLSVTKDGVVPQLETAAKSSDHNNRKLVLKDDFVINSRSDRKMSAGIAYSNGSVSVINTVIYSNSMSKEYTKYLLKNYSFAEEFYRWGSGIVADLWSTRWDKMKNISIPIPDIDEQVKIGKKLDTIIKKIDSIINETKLSIEEFKRYKQSIITETVTKGLKSDVEMESVDREEIKYHPKHWTLSKIKYHVEIDPSKHEHLCKLPSEATFLPMNKLKNGFIINTEKDKTEKLENKYTYFAEGDIVIAKVRPSFENGNIAVAKNLLNKTGFGTSEIFVLRNKDKGVIQEFLFYFLRNDIFIQYGSSSMTGVAGLQRVSTNFIMNYPIAVPPLEEQLEIVNYLNYKIKQIDKLITKKVKAIEELENYKKSLIYEYVTGKREV
ncbi:MAG: restriction endonuclease subunit S [Virgibacillus proomii]